jgi:phage minor structural protein
MLEVFNKLRQRVAVLENAFNVVEEEKLNEVGKFTFSLPENDAKNVFCAPYAFVRWNEGAYYRIIADNIKRGGVDIHAYTCEHCVATLSDDLLFSTLIIGGAGVATRQILESLLTRQRRSPTSDERWWVLDECDFDHRHEYVFESETIYSALWAVAEPFPEPRVWRYDFDAFPWRLSLKLIDTKDAPDYYIRAGKNLLSEDSSNDAYEVCTRLYALGNGKGVNQVKIGSVNGGLDYLESPPQYIQKYGRIDKLFVDRRYETPEILLAAARAALNEIQEPKYTRKFGVVDLEKLTNDRLDAARVGEVVRLTDDDTSAYVTSIRRNHDVDGDMRIEISNRFTSLVDMLENLANKQRVEMLYGQGATIVYGDSIQTNADTGNSAELKLSVPKEMKYVNKVWATVALEPYRTYSKGSAAGGGTTQSSTANGAIPTKAPVSGEPTSPVKTSAAGGGGQLIVYVSLDRDLAVGANPCCERPLAYSRGAAHVLQD